MIGFVLELAYANGTFQNQALPNGFSKSNISSFYRTNGPPISCLFNNSFDRTNADLYFHVAKIIGTPFYLGVQESSPNYKTWRLSLRLSSDLINWSEPKLLYSADTPWGGPSQNFHYPTFLDKSGSTNEAINPDEFYIMGNGATGASGYNLNVMKLSLTIPQWVLSPDTVPASLITHYYRTILGYPETAFIRENGLYYWLNYVKNGGTCTNMAKQFFFGPYLSSSISDETFIRKLYEGLINGWLLKITVDATGKAQPADSSATAKTDADGYNYWKARLNALRDRRLLFDEVVKASTVISTCQRYGVKP